MTNLLHTLAFLGARGLSISLAILDGAATVAVTMGLHYFVTTFVIQQAEISSPAAKTVVVIVGSLITAFAGLALDLCTTTEKRGRLVRFLVSRVPLMCLSSVLGFLLALLLNMPMS